MQTDIQYAVRTIHNDIKHTYVVAQAHIVARSIC